MTGNIVSPIYPATDKSNTNVCLYGTYIVQREKHCLKTNKETNKRQNIDTKRRQRDGEHAAERPPALWLFFLCFLLLAGPALCKLD